MSDHLLQPIASCHQQLGARAARDPGWTIAPRCAVGAASGTVEINVSANEVSSSILPMLDAPLISLDQKIGARFPGDAPPLGLKISVQGCESAVLDGEGEIFTHLRVIYLEMQLQPLYEGSTMFDEMSARLGYRCIAISEGFTDAERFEVLQVDGLFVRDQPTPSLLASFYG